MEELLERMNVLLAAMEAAAERLGGCEMAITAQADERIDRIVATVEAQRETELAKQLEATQGKLVEAEARIAELTASAAAGYGRKTSAVGMIATLGKQAIAADGREPADPGRIEAGALDGALASLSIEQRFAVKAELHRTGLLA